MPANDPEGPPDVDAKHKARLILDDPKHKRERGHKDDEATRDDDLTDPAKQKGDK